MMAIVPEILKNLESENFGKIYCRTLKKKGKTSTLNKNHEILPNF